MPLDYREKLILAPMVRITTLPTRLLALDHGADIVYCEEIIDFKLLQCKRVENKLLGTVDFVWNDETVVFRTCPEEKERLVFQIGTANAQRALKVAKLVENDVSGIDINMGCPKEFSVKGGMGAALLSKPETAKEILTAVVNGVKVPVTCKIRLLPTLEQTIDFAKMVEQTGIAALIIHGRRKEERPCHPNHNDYIQRLTQAVSVPVIANGGSKEIKCYADIPKFKESTGCCSVMIARAAMWNPSIFRKDGMVSTDEIIKGFLKYAVKYDSNITHVKYTVQQMLHEELATPRGMALQASGTAREICGLFGLEDFYDEALRKRETLAEELKKTQEVPVVKKRKLDDGSELFEYPYKFNRKEFKDDKSPKMTLYQWTLKQKIKKPLYETVEQRVDQTFYSTVTVDGKKYANKYWDKSKRCAEQAAAVVCLKVLEVDYSECYREMVTLSKTTSYKKATTKENGTVISEKLKNTRPETEFEPTPSEDGISLTDTTDSEKHTQNAIPAAENTDR